MRHVAALAASAARPIIFREAAYFAVLACARVSIRARRPALDKEGLCDGARFVVVLNAQPTRDAAVCVLLSHRRREARTRAYGGARVCHARSQRTASLPRAQAGGLTDLTPGRRPRAPDLRARLRRERRHEGLAGHRRSVCGNERMISHLGSSGANSMSAAKAEKPAPNVRSIPFWPGCGRPLSRISRKTNRTDGDDILP